MRREAQTQKKCGGPKGGGRRGPKGGGPSPYPFPPPHHPQKCPNWPRQRGQVVATVGRAQSRPKQEKLLAKSGRARGVWWWGWEQTIPYVLESHWSSIEASEPRLHVCQASDALFRV